MSALRYRNGWLLSLAVLLFVGGALFWWFSIKHGRKFAESAHGIVLPKSAFDIQTKRSGFGFEYWGTDNYIVSVFRMNKTEFNDLTNRLSVVRQYTEWEWNQYPWPIPFDEYGAVSDTFLDKHAMIDFSSSKGDGLRCYAWETDDGLFVRLTTAFF